MSPLLPSCKDRNKTHPRSQTSLHCHQLCPTHVPCVGEPGESRAKFVHIPSGKLLVFWCCFLEEQSCCEIKWKNQAGTKLVTLLVREITGHSLGACGFSTGKLSVWCCKWLLVLIAFRSLHNVLACSSCGCLQASCWGWWLKCDTWHNSAANLKRFCCGRQCS